VQIHMAHRLMGVVAGTLAIAACIAVFRASAGHPALRRISAAVPAMVLVQIALGAGIILTWRELATMTLHQATGAAILAAMVSTWVLTRRPAAVLSAVPETRAATLPNAEGAKA
jgi:heme A synthase